MLLYTFCSICQNPLLACVSSALQSLTQLNALSSTLSAHLNLQLEVMPSCAPRLGDQVGLSVPAQLLQETHSSLSCCHDLCHSKPSLMPCSLARLTTKWQVHRKVYTDHKILPAQRSEYEQQPCPFRRECTNNLCQQDSSLTFWLGRSRHERSSTQPST